MSQKGWPKYFVPAILIQLIRLGSADSNKFGLVSSQSYGIAAPKDCAVQCRESGYNPANWSTFSATTDYFEKCSWEPTLFMYNIGGQNSSVAIKACVGSEEGPTEELLEPTTVFCPPGPLYSVSNTEVSGRPAKEPTKAVPGQVLGAGLVIKDSLLRHSVERVTNGVAVHAHYGNAVVGVFLGSDLDMIEFAHGALEDFLTAVEIQGIGQTLQTQLCGQNSPGKSAAFGIIADTSSGVEAFSIVRNAVSAWSQGACTENLGLVSRRARFEFSPPRAGNWTGLNEQKINKSDGLRVEVRQINRLALYGPECRTGTVSAGDSCGTLAVKCGVSGNDFMKFNRKHNLCATLVPGQLICCSEGDLPDIRPKIGSKGDCAMHNVAQGEWCAAIATKYGLTVEELESFNKKTWGWTGCNNLRAYTKLCVSEGEPPFPAAQSTAVCGPTKPGTRKPPGSKSTDWALLNECPLKACCNIWGNCGTTENFCINQSTGPPGSSSGRNGCVSNCGMAITNIKQAPTEFRRIGYFEAWNNNRKCLHMDITDIPSGKYTHIHYAFADIDFSYKVSVAKNQDQFDRFKRAKDKGYRRILAFGGWAFSTEAATANIFRAGVRAGNRERLSSNLVDFIIENDLDGIDFDWEYPGVPDMNWLPPSSPDEGPNYAEFLRLVRSKLPADKSVSIAAPASFWYLKAFPIEKISKIVNYIVYMTYDLHGQWDYGNKWSMAGCERGNCLRSHVDLAETYNALAMITKAGVPSHKITVGITSYGRQFKMTDPNCSHENCTYVGPKSSATPGRCTETPEYISNAEIKEIVRNNPSAKVKDAGGFSKSMTYDGNWVSFMDDNDKIGRTSLWRGMNFGGVVDWAIDLNSFDYDDEDGGSNGPIGPLGGSKQMRGGAFHEKATVADMCGKDDSWKSVQCTTKGIAETDQLDADEIWADVKADAAWCAALTYWHSGKSKKNFTAAVSKFLRGSPDFHCEELVTKNGCNTPQFCQDNQHATGAAMQIILQSMHNVNQQFMAMYDGLRDAQGAIASPMIVFKKKFIPKPDRSLEIALNILSLAIGFGTPTFFNSFLKPLVSKKSDRIKTTTDNLQDYTATSLSFGLNQAKDINKDMASKGLTDVKDKIDYIFSETVMDWKESLTVANDAIFNGNEDSLRMLDKLLQRGNSLTRNSGFAIDFQISATKFLFSALLPEIWRMQGYYPVLLDTAWDCKTTGIGVRQWTKRKNVMDLVVCLNDRQYQLWGLRGSWVCRESSSNPCFSTRDCNNYLTELPGLDYIKNPQKEFGDMSMFSLSDSAFDGYFNVWHGNHKYTADDAKNGDLVNLLAQSADFGIDISKLPGIVNIPMCTWAEIEANWRKGVRDENRDTYPCNNSGNR